MERVGRGAPLPKEMQGRWVDAEDPSTQLIVSGGEITCFGEVVDYDYKLVGDQDGVPSPSASRSTMRRTRTRFSVQTSQNW